MKILTANFLTCAVKSCKSSPASYPLHFRDAELEQSDLEYNPRFLRNILPRVDWEALRVTAVELGFTNLPLTKPSIDSPSNPSNTLDPTPPQSLDQEQEPSSTPPDAPEQQPEAEMGAVSQEEGDQTDLYRTLHTLLLETEVREGSLVCGNCGHVYRIKEGIANFLLPGHLV